MWQTLAFLQAENPLLVIAIATAFGLLIGSFLNVVIYRLPVMLQRDWQQQARDILEISPADEDPPGVFNLILPNSHCPTCDHAIRAWENIPVVSYILLAGRCSECKTHISFRYPLIELLTAILTATVINHFGMSPTGLLACLLTWSLIALAMIDYDTQLLPDDITLPLLWLGLVANYFSVLTNLPDAVLGAVFGYMVFWVVFQVFKLVTGKEGMGYGDFKLLSMLGAWMGWQALPLIIILSSFTGALIGGILIVLGRDKSHPIPFGPYLAIAGLIALLWGDDITSSYLQFANIK